MHFSTWRAFAIFLIAALICAIAVPNVLSQTAFDALPKPLQRKMVLGLDLQGGSHLLLQVDADFVRKEKGENLRDDVRRVLRETKIGYTNLTLQGLTVSVRIRDEKDVPEALRKLRELSQPLAGVFAGSNIQDLEITESGGLIRLTITNAGIVQRIGQSSSNRSRSCASASTNSVRSSRRSSGRDWIAFSYRCLASITRSG